jgi:hypothetical protein
MVGPGISGHKNGGGGVILEEMKVQYLTVLKNLT